MRFAAFPLLLAVLFTGCDSEDKDPTDSDEPTGETDDDTTGEESDTESGESESDTDSEGAPPASFDGTASYTVEIGGETVCDMEMDLAGSAYTGYCPGCDLAFAMEPTVTSDASSADCDPAWKWTFAYESSYYDFGFYLAHRETAEIFDYYTYSYTEQSNVLQWGYGIGYDYAYWMYTYLYEDATYGNVSFDGSELEWEYEASYSDYSLNTDYVYDEYYFTYGWYFYGTSYATGTYSGFTETEQDLDCDGLIIDIWTMDLTEGDEVGISIDTIADDSAFDPWMIIRDTDGSAIYMEDDSFDCTYEPAAYQCPSGAMAVPATGTYSVMVGSYGSCNGTEAHYSISVDAGSDPGLSLETDNGTLYNAESVTVTASGKGSVTMK